MASRSREEGKGALPRPRLKKREEREEAKPAVEAGRLLGADGSSGMPCVGSVVRPSWPVAGGPSCPGLQLEDACDIASRAPGGTERDRAGKQSHRQVTCMRTLLLTAQLGRSQGCVVPTESLMGPGAV